MQKSKPDHQTKIPSQKSPHFIQDEGVREKRKEGKRGSNPVKPKTARELKTRRQERGSKNNPQKNKFCALPLFL